MRLFSTLTDSSIGEITLAYPAVLRFVLHCCLGGDCFPFPRTRVLALAFMRSSIIDHGVFGSPLLQVPSLTMTLLFHGRRSSGFSRSSSTWLTGSMERHGTILCRARPFLVRPTAVFCVPWNFAWHQNGTSIFIIFFRKVRYPIEVSIRPTSYTLIRHLKTTYEWINEAQC
jgi:hypothetical protein